MELAMFSFFCLFLKFDKNIIILFSLISMELFLNISSEFLPFSPKIVSLVLRITLIVSLAIYSSDAALFDPAPVLSYLVCLHILMNNI